MKDLLKCSTVTLFIATLMMTTGLASLAKAADESVVPAIVVKFKPGLSSAEQTAVVERNGGVETSSIPALRMHVIAIPNAAEQEQILLKYQSDSSVERVEISKQRQAEGTPNDAFYDRQWALRKIGWDRVFRTIPSGNATVALLDTGVDAGHPDLGEDIVLAGVSMLDSQSNGRTDLNGHGTWLAGIIGAMTDNGDGIAGLCTGGIKILPVTVLNEQGIGSDGDIITGIDWAVRNGADVILMGFSNADFSQSLQEMIDYAWQQGVVLIAAVGNAGVGTPTFPAGARGVVGVSATTEQDTLLPQSNYGEAVFLAAPGDNILTTNSDAQGLYTNVSGTSAASAIVAGVAAFMKAVDPALTNGIIVGRLAKSADPIGALGDPDNQIRFGNGRINMFNALAHTSTGFIMPSGAAPLGTGGPYVGPYTAAASGPFNVRAEFSASTSTITAMGEGLNQNWIYQYSYETPSGSVTYHPCTGGIDAASDSMVLASGFPTGTWKVSLLAYNPSYQTCLDNGTATRTATIMTDVTVTTAYMSVVSATGTYDGTVTLSASLTIGTPLSGKTITFTLNGSNAGSAVTNGSGVATLYGVPLGSINAGSYPTGIGASFAGDGYYTSSSAIGGLTVDRATPAITAWPAASAISYGQTISESTLSGGSTSVGGSFSFDSPLTVPNAGTYSAAVTFTPDNANYYTVSGSVPVVVNKLTPVVTEWPVAGSLTYGQPLSAATLSGGSVSVAGSFAFASPATMPESGYYSAIVIFSPDDPNYNAVNGSVSVTVLKATPTVTTWPVAAASLIYGQVLSESALSGGSASVAGSFSFDSPTTLLNAGSHSVAVIFTPSNTNYLSVSGTIAVTVSKATPTITSWPTAATLTYGQAVSESTLSGGSASVAGSFSFDSPTTVPNAGTHSAAVIFNPENSNYNSVSGTIPVVVSKATPTVIAWPMASPLTYGQLLSGSALSGGSASVIGSFSFDVPATIPNAGSYSAVVTFTPTDTNYDTVSGTVAVPVSKATPIITAWPAASRISYGQPLSGSELAGGSTSVAGIFSFDSPTTVLEAGDHSVTVTFTPSDSTNYATASGTVNITVTPVGQVISFASLPDVAFGVLPFTVYATATSGLSVEFASMTPAVCTVSGNLVTIAGVGTCTITATQQGNLNIYPANPVAQSFTVNPGELDHFAFSNMSSPQVAGVPFSITVTAQDAWDHTVTPFTGMVDLSTTAGTITPAVAQPFIDGVWTGTVTVNGAGIGKTITATASGKTGTGDAFDVSPGAAVAFTVTAPAITQAGNSLDVTVTAKDAYDNTATDYAGTIRFMSTDPNGVLPADYSFSAGDKGVGRFTDIVLETAGTQTITAADIAASSISGTSGSIAVSPAGAAKLSVTSPATATAGIPFDLTVSVKDAYDNNIAGYTGTISFTTSDLQGTAPENYSFVAEDNGSHIFVGMANLKTSGTHTFTAVDLLNPSITGTSGSIALNPATARTLVFSQQPVTTMVGEPITPAVAVSLMDEYGNLATGSTAEVTVALAEASHSGTLTGTTTVNAVNGIAVFPGLSITTAGNGFILTANNVSMTTIHSVIFDIILGTCGKPATLTVPASNITGTISLAWSASDVADATYILEQSKDGGVFTQVYSGTTTSTSITVTASGNYAYRVKAMKDGYIASDYTVGSNACSVQISCPAPALLNVPAANSTGVISLAWSPSSLGGVTYKVEQSKDGGAFIQVLAVTGTAGSVPVTANGTYTFRIKAVKEGYLDSSYTDGSTGCVVYLVCGKPASLDVPIANSTGTIAISWSASDVSGATYILEQNRDGGGFTEVYSGTSVSANIVVTANGTYAYRVKVAKANYVTSDYTLGSNGCIVRLVCKKPAAITVPAANSTGTFWVTWRESDVSGATYTLEQSKDGEPFIPIYTGTNLSMNLTVTANGTYSYRVRATKDGYEASDYTVGSNGCLVHLACGKPASITVPATNSTGTFWVTWRESDVSGATYVLEQSKDGAPFTEVYNGTTTTASIEITANGAYTYRVKAMRTGYDTSDYTLSSNGCLVHLACGKPASLTVPATNSTGTFWVSWGASDVSNATYVVEESRNGGAFTEVYSGTTTSASITVAVNGTYTYRVKAMRTGYDTSDYTVGSAGCVVHLACGKPASLSVPVTNSTGTISMSWNPSDVSGATYVLEQSRAGGAFTEVYNGTSTSASITVTGNDTYSYRVKALKTGYDTSDYTVGGNGCIVYLVCGRPAVVTVPAANSTGIFSISWSPSDVGGVTYILEQSRDGGDFTEVHSGTNTSASIAVTANATYTYRVKAIKTNYVPSDYTVGGTSCLVRLVCGKPAAVTVPPANSTGILSITWSASDVSGVTYILEQSMSGGQFIEVYSGTNTSASISVTANGTYSYRVKAIRTNYEGSDYAVGSTACLVRLACGNPSAITVPAANSTGTLWVTWRESDVSGVTYVLEQSKDGGAFTEVYSGLNLSASITVPASGTYTYRVKAMRTGYETSEYTVGSNGCVVRLACGSPASLTVPAVSTTKEFWVTWRDSDVSGVTYVLEQSKDGGAFVQVYGGVNNAVNIAVTADGTYSYRVMAYRDGYEASDWTIGTTPCVVRTVSGIRVAVPGQGILYFQTLSAALSGIPDGSSVSLNTWATTLVENIDLNKNGSILTIGSAFDEAYTAPVGPTVIRGIVSVTSGTLVADNLVVL